MTKAISVLFLLIVGAAALAAAAPALARFVSAMVPLVLVAGILAAVLRVVWWFTR